VVRLRSLTPFLRYLLDPRVTPENALAPRHPAFSTGWDRETRTLGRERSDRRHFAGEACRRERAAGFEELGL
jgi:hypothetical protein